MAQRVQVFDQNYVTNKCKAQHSVPISPPRSARAFHHISVEMQLKTISVVAAVWEEPLVGGRGAVSLKGEAGGHTDAG